jgi:hypothetical protein
MMVVEVCFVVRRCIMDQKSQSTVSTPAACVNQVKMVAGIVMGDDKEYVPATSETTRSLTISLDTAGSWRDLETIEWSTFPSAYNQDKYKPLESN